MMHYSNVELVSVQEAVCRLCINIVPLHLRDLCICDFGIHKGPETNLPQSRGMPVYSKTKGETH